LKPELHAENAREIGRVLGWGAKCDDAHEAKAQTVMPRAFDVVERGGVVVRPLHFHQKLFLNQVSVSKMKPKSHVIKITSTNDTGHRNQTTPPQQHNQQQRARTCAAAFDEQPVA